MGILMLFVFMRFAIVHLVSPTKLNVGKTEEEKNGRKLIIRMNKKNGRHVHWTVLFLVPIDFLVISFDSSISLARPPPHSFAQRHITPQLFPWTKWLICAYARVDFDTMC